MRDISFLRVIEVAATSLSTVESSAPSARSNGPDATKPPPTDSTA
jgi:hypothetical protein